MMTKNGSNIAIGVAVTVIGGFILALLIAECRDIRATHDAIIRLESNKPHPSATP